MFMVLVTFVCGAQATFVTSWDSWSGVTTVADTDTDASDNYRDIVSISHYYDGSDYHYFKLELESGSGTPIGGATDYMINFDSIDGGQDDTTSIYVADGLTGIDQIIDTHVGNATYFSAATGGHNHISSDGATGDTVNFTFNSLSGYDADFQGGTSYLEWKISGDELLSDSFVVYGSSLTAGSTTYDITSGLTVIPEPATFAMLGVTAFGCLMVRRIFC
jgi:hypothetical protein